jgi:hypothetical protein
VKYPYLSLGLPARPSGCHFKPFQLPLIIFQPKSLTSTLANAIPLLAVKQDMLATCLTQAQTIRG